MAAVLPISKVTSATLNRTTRDGRELTYQLNVIQQPERARACGSGAKSSADRRPVDPPPVVELKIFEGPSKTDVTFNHNANFFLFTTLEPARVINHGRLPVTQTATPVLTGAPVAGMVYLDRPMPAGYFIFPDLSVRHEGMYRLSFSLYEDVKEEKDADPSRPSPSPMCQESPSMAARGHVHFRLEVKSEPFPVYSAKKFPGLGESTNLSRTVADQGCRVRIRREVRLRRRDKVTDNYQNAGSEEQYTPSNRHATPQQLPDRQRSASNVSIDPQTPYGMGRRPSIHDAPYYHHTPYQQAIVQPPQPPTAHPPPPIPAPASFTSHLNFGAQPTQAYSKPSIAAPPPPPLSAPSQQVHPPSAGYGSCPPHVQGRQPSTPQEYGQTYGNPQQSPYRYAHHYNEGQTGGLSSRRPSTGTEGYMSGSGFDNYHHKEGVPSQQPPVARALTPINTDTRNFQSHQSNTLPSVSSLLQQTTSEDRCEPVSANSGMPQGPHNPYSATSLSSYSTSSNVTPHSANPTYNSDPLSSRMPPSYPNEDPASRTSKRPYGHAFDTSHFNQPQHSGSRPNPLNYAQDTPKIETDDGDLADAYDDSVNTLVYKRANGTQQAKKCPSPRDRRRGTYIPIAGPQ